MQEKFTELLEKDKNVVYKVCNLYADGVQDKQDLLQEILYQAWLSFKNFKSESKFSTWLYRVALNTAFTYLKNKSRRKNISVRLTEPSEYTHLPEHTQGEEINILYKAIESLSAVDKALILLYIDNYDYLEIAGIMGLSVSNVGVKINRIKQFLKQQGDRLINS